MRGLVLNIASWIRGKIRSQKQTMGIDKEDDQIYALIVQDLLLKRSQMISNIPHEISHA